MPLIKKIINGRPTTESSTSESSTTESSTTESSNAAFGSSKPKRPYTKTL